MPKEMLTREQIEMVGEIARGLVDAMEGINPHVALQALLSCSTMYAHGLGMVSVRVGTVSPEGQALLTTMTVGPMDADDPLARSN